jgi:hypothetical protein
MADSESMVESLREHQLLPATYIFTFAHGDGREKLTNQTLHLTPQKLQRREISIRLQSGVSKVVGNTLVSF